MSLDHVMENDDGSVLVGDAALLDALTSSSKRTACMARGASSGFCEALIDWANAELERGTCPADLMHATGILMMQCYGSMVGSLFEAGADQPARKGFVAIIETELPQHIRRSRENAVQRAAE